MVEPEALTHRLPLSQELRRLPSVEMLPRGPVDVVLMPGMGPVPAQLRGPEGARRPVADFERMRAIAIAGNELAANGFVKADGFLIPTGRATANTADVQNAYAQTPAFREKFAAAMKVRIVNEKPGTGEMTPSQFLATYPEFKSIQGLQRLLGRPQTEAEMAIILETTEAGLMEDLQIRTRPKSHRETTQIKLPEILASNTIENIVRTINLLDTEAKKRGDDMWRGTIAIVSSNFGHIQRIKEIFKALGIGEDRIVPLSADAVLRHAGYDPKYLDKYEREDLNLDTDLGRNTLKSQERWRRGVREMPQYVLPEIALIENDARLFQVMEALQDWYGEEMLRKIDPDLIDIKRFTAEQIRGTLGKIERQKPPESWGDLDDAKTAAWVAENAAYTDLTKAWLQQNSPS